MYQKRRKRKMKRKLLRFSLFAGFIGLLCGQGQTAEACVNDADVVHKGGHAEAIISRSVSEKKWSQEQKTLVLLVEFEDEKITYDSQVWFDQLFNMDKKSVANYYDSETGGRINIVPVNESNTAHEGIVKVKLDYDHPRPWVTIDERNRKIVRDALEKTDDLIDYSVYDRNNNKQIEQDELHIMTIVAGDNAQDVYNDGVWPHQAGLYGNTALSLDGVGFRYYTQFGEVSSEWRGFYTHTMPHIMGVIAHEMGHDMGLADLYGTNSLGYTSLMGIGSSARLESGISGNNMGEHSPTGLDAYSKMMLGEPVVTIDPKEEQTISISSRNGDDNTIYKILTDNPKEYLLLDNRQYEGYDAVLSRYTAKSGIGIYKINENYTNNLSSGGALVTLLNADESISGLSNSLNDPFYYVGEGKHNVPQGTKLSANTVPAAVFEDGTSMDISLEVISESKESMDVKIYGKPVAVEGVSLTPETVEIETGETKQLNAEIVPEKATEKGVTWSSSNNDVVSISSSGLITGKKAGEAIVTVKTVDGNKTATSKVKVTTPIIPVASVAITPENPVFMVDDEVQLTAAVMPENATDKWVEWSSSDETVIEVTSGGVATAKKVGYATITVKTIDGNKTASSTITVKQKDDYGNNRPEAEIMELNKEYVGEINYSLDYDCFAFLTPDPTKDYKLILEPLNTKGEKLSARISSLNNYLVNDTYYDLSGNLTEENGVKTYHLENAKNAKNHMYIMLSGTVGDQYRMKLIEGDTPVEKIELDKEEITLSVGEYTAVTATITPTYATQQSLAWSTADENIATARATSTSKFNRSGTIVGKKPGTTVLTAETPEGKKKEIKVTILADDYGSSRDESEIIELNKEYVGKIDFAVDYDCFAFTTPDPTKNYKLILEPINTTSEKLSARILSVDDYSSSSIHYNLSGNVTEENGTKTYHLEYSKHSKKHLSIVIQGAVGDQYKMKLVEE